MAHKILEEIIGKNIARYREAAGLTQATLAEKSDQTPPLSQEWSGVRRK